MKEVVDIIMLIFFSGEEEEAVQISKSNKKK